jgi:ATP-dependent protease ClpP protease subunit
MTREISIYKSIGSQPGEYGPEMLRQDLARAAGQPVTIRLNSEGGNVIDGVACFNLLRQYPGKVTCHVDGMALSIASVIAMAADELVVPANAWMMIHNPANEAAGDGDDLREMASLLDGMRDQLAAIYSARSRKPVSEVCRMMAAETWMTGKQAVEAGFADRTSAPLAVAATFDARQFRNAPRQSQTPATFQAHVELAMARGLTRAKAVRAAIIERPDLHRAFVQAANADRPRAGCHRR